MNPDVHDHLACVPLPNGDEVSIPLDKVIEIRFLKSTNKVRFTYGIPGHISIIEVDADEWVDTPDNPDDTNDDSSAPKVSIEDLAKLWNPSPSVIPSPD